MPHNLLRYCISHILVSSNSAQSEDVTQKMTALSWILELSSQLMFAATILGLLASETTQPLAARSCDWLLTF